MLKLSTFSLLCFRMETYNELLKEFHEELSPKTFTLQYKSLYDELTLNRTRKKAELRLKKQELKHQRQASPQPLNTSFTSFISLSQNTKMTSSRLEVSCIGESQLKKQYAELQFQVKSLKAKTIQITNQLKIFQSKEQEVKQTNKFNNFSVFNHYQQVSIQASCFNTAQMKENQMLHGLKARKEQLKEEIEDLVKKKEIVDNLKKRLAKAKESKVLQQREPQHQNPQFRNILRIFDILTDLCHSYETNKEIKVEEFQLKYDRQSSKQLFRDYYNKGHPYDRPTAMKIVSLYRKLQTDLDRNERAHQQATQSLATFQASYDSLTDILRKIHAKKEKYSLTALKQYYNDIQHLQKRFQFSCNRVNKFTSQLYQFLKKFNAYINTLEHILQQTTVGKRIMEVFPDCKVLKQYQENLYRNPEESTMSIKNCELYLKDIKKNNLFRMYYLPENVSPEMDQLQNYEKLVTIAFKKANEFITMMFKMISQYFKIMKNQKKVTSSQENNASYCIESKDYYRRDNFKLLEKLENEQLKRKGLLMKIPINVVFDSEINEEKVNKTYTSSRSLTPRGSAISRTFMKYTDLASKREEHSIKKQKIRRLFGKLESIERTPAAFSRYRSPLQSSRLTVAHSSSNLSLIRNKVLCKTRKTVGMLSKQNMQTEFPK